MRGAPRPEGWGAAPCRRCCAAAPRETSGPATERLAANSAGDPSPSGARLQPASVLRAQRGSSDRSRSSSLLGAAFNRLR